MTSGFAYYLCNICADCEKPFTDNQQGLSWTYADIGSERKSGDYLENDSSIKKQFSNRSGDCHATATSALISQLGPYQFQGVLRSAKT